MLVRFRIILFFQTSHTLTACFFALFLPSPLLDLVVKYTVSIPITLLSVSLISRASSSISQIRYSAHCEPGWVCV